MLKQYIITAIRSFKKNKFYAIVNILGLATGITTFILIACYVHYHLSYDRFYPNHKRICRVDRIVQLADEVRRGNESWFPISKELKNRFPEIEEAVVTRPVFGEYLSSSEEMTFYQRSGMYAEDAFFKIFSFEFIEGSPENALSETFSMVLSEKIAKKFFPGEPALGKTIRVRNKYDFRVTGVYRNLPENTAIDDWEYISSMKSFDYFHETPTENNWGYINFHSYILLKENTKVTGLNQKYTNLLREFVKDTPDQVHLTKLTDIHLFGDEEDKTYLLLKGYSILALFALIVACINFINLSTALSTTRAKEVGIKKIVGSRRIGLIKQFITETVLITFLGLLTAFLLTIIFLPVFSQIVDEPLTLTIKDHWQLILFIVVAILLTGTFSGLYPAFMLSSFNPVKAIKNPFSTGGQKAGMRKTLVTFQFALTSIIIFCTILFLGQFRFMKNKHRGFNSENVLLTELDGRKNLTTKDYKVLVSEIKMIPGVQDVTISEYLPYKGYISWPVNWEGSQPDEMIRIRRNWIGHNYFSFYNIDLVAGRYFSEMGEHESQSCIINETAAKKLGWTNPIGKRIDNNQFTVIGVVKDFHVNSVVNKIPPCIFLPKKGSLDEQNVFSIKTTKYANNRKLKNTIENTISEYVPEEIVEVKLFDETIRDGVIKIYYSIVKTFSFFATITILLSLFGLFGLVSFTLKRKTKEVGIRKSLGSKVIEIFILLVKDYALIIVIALIIGLPSAFLFDTIDPAAYKAPVNWFHLALGYISIIVVAFLSIGYQTFKAAVVNPVKALRYE